MITKEKLEEFMQSPRQVSDSEVMAMCETIESLYRENEELKQALSGRTVSCSICNERIPKLEKVAEAAKLLNEREPKISSICGIQKALSELDGKP